MSRWLKCTSTHFNTDWNKYDDRLMKAVERVEVDKVASILSKKGIIPTKLDVEGRSAFHLAATRGHLDCLNLMLAHNVDTTATDATGKNALHLASRNGHSLCVQKLLQHNCPVGNGDLQGRTALHDAVMAGCASSVKLLCDSGASVNTSDFDGRTPLVLATQMCHPRICQLLLERGADITLRDKQNKTALILGCEYGCRDAVEILLMCGADVTAVDCFSHDPYHYARLNKNQELAVLVKTYLDNVNRAKEATKMEQRKRQQSVESEVAEANKRDQIIHDLERQNESQQEGLRMFHQEQRALLDNVNLLQQQLAQEKLTVETINKEREQLKLLLSVKEREEGIRSPETVKVQLRSTLGDYSGQSVIKGKENVLVKQSHSLDSAQILQSPTSARSVVRRAETTQPSAAQDTSGEVDALRRELEAARKRQRAAEDEAARLQSALARKSQECQELSQSRESAQRQADQQVQDLEDALGDVQKRMLDSECKVKQLQAHVVAVKEHLGGQAADELRAQLKDVKAKYEGASAEVCRVRNRLKQSEKALEEYKSSEGQLAAEVERLGHELGALSGERDQLGSALLEAEQRLKEAKQGAVVPAEKFDNMKNLLTNAVDEKERQLAELREDYDRVLEEVADLHRRQDDRPTQGAKEKALEEQNGSLKRKLADILAKRQALIQDVEDTEEEKEILREQLDELKSRMEVGFVPLAEHEEARRSMMKAMGELEDQLVDASERCGRAEAQVSHLQAERASLRDDVAALRSAGVKQRCEADALASQNAALAKELEEARGRCDDREREAARLSTQCESLEERLAGELVSRRQQEQAKGELAGALESSEARLRHLESREQERSEELKKVLEGSDKLKERLEEVLSEMERDHVSLKEHEAVKVELSAAVAEAESRAKEASVMYASAKEETARLNQELEAQKKELDTIQEAIQSRFVPLTAVAERESAHDSQLKALAARLADAEGRCEAEKAEAERGRREAERLTAEVESVRRALESISGEKRREAEQEHKDQLEELTLKLVDLEQQYKEVTVQRAELEERNALCAVETRGLQQRLDAELARLDECEWENHSLEDAARQAQAEYAAARDARLEEAQRRTELQGVHAEQGALLQQHVQAKEVLQAEVSALQAEVSALRLALEESSGRRQESGQDVSALQAELLQASQALEELRLKEAQAGVLQADKRRLEEELAGVGGRLLLLAQECQELQREAEEVRAGKDGAKKELENVQQRGHAVEREIRELKERYDDSLCTIGSLQKRIQTSSELTEVKDKKITELLTDVERLKQALNGLSQLAYAGSAPNKRQTQHIDTLQVQIKGLQQQLADAERQHREVVSIYRTHLLSAAQGHMDEDVQAALLQIIRMRQEFVC